MLIFKHFRRQAGDTLVEVVIALAILSAVLIASTIVAASAYRLGQTARERTAVSNAAQGQVEAMRAFRDSHTWGQFLNGGTIPSAYKGVLTAAVGTGCHVTSPCQHMQPLSGTTFVPVDGSLAGPLPTSYIEIVVTPAAGAVPRSVDVTVNYGIQSLSGSKDNVGHIKTTFTDLGYAATPPPPPPAPPCSGSITDIVLVLDVSGSMGQNFGGGSRLDASKSTANGFIDKANIGPATNHIAVVEFSDSPTLDVGLTGDTGAAKAAINGMNAGGGTHYIPALALAGQILAGGRPGVAKTIVFMSDGQARDNNATQGVQTEMAKLPAGTRMYTIGIRADGEDMSLLYQVMPMGGGTYGDATDPAKLQQIYTDIAGAIACSS